MPAKPICPECGEEMESIGLFEGEGGEPLVGWECVEDFEREYWPEGEEDFE